MQLATLKVTQIGNSLGVILPKEISARLDVRKGDILCCVDTPQGVELTPFDPAFEHRMRVARALARRYRNALRELAR